MAEQAIVVKEYKGRGDFNKDAQRMAERGYVVTNVTENNRRAGCARIGCIGLFALAFKPKPTIIVTYQLHPPAPAARR